jgi:hypothetical protein
MSRTSPSFSPDSSSFSNDNSFDDVSQGLEEEKQLTIRRPFFTFHHARLT